MRHELDRLIEQEANKLFTVKLCEALRDIHAELKETKALVADLAANLQEDME